LVLVVQQGGGENHCIPRKDQGVKPSPRGAKTVKSENPGGLPKKKKIIKKESGGVQTKGPR